MNAAPSVPTSRSFELASNVDASGAAEAAEAESSPPSADGGASTPTTARPSPSGAELLAALDARTLERLAPTGTRLAVATPSATASGAEVPLGLTLLQGLPELATDPTLLLMQLGEHLAAQSTRADRGAVESHRIQEAEAAERRQEAMAAAQRASRRAERWAGHLPPWVQKLTKAITIIAGVAGAAFTGGTSLGLAIAGAVLILGSEGITKLAVRLGMEPERAQYLGMACQIAGAALMAGAGGAGGAGTATSTALARAVDTTERIRSVVDATLQVAQGTRDIGAAVNVAQSTNASLDADAHGLRGESADERMRQVLEAMQRSLESMTQLREKVLAMNDEENRRSMETVEAIGR